MSSDFLFARTPSAPALLRPGEVPLAVRQAGAGPVTFVFLHGFGEGSFVWDFFLTRVHGKGRSVLPDFRGHGDSPWSPDGVYSSGAHARDVLGLLGQSSEPLIVFGHSMGAGVALQIAAAMPERVSRLVLVDYGIEGNSAFRERLFRQFEVSLRPFETHAQYAEYLLQDRPLMSPEIAAHVAARALRRDGSGQLRIKCDPELRVAELERDAERARRYMRAVRCPTLLVRGEGSAAVSRAQVRSMAEQFADVRVEEVRAAGHGVMLDNPVGFARAVLSTGEVCG